MDGADISQWDREHLGKYIGYLPQDIELFDGTISENIARFTEVNPKKVIEAAMKAGVHEMILRLPEGYDTVIGNGAVVLSGGQRQRIGLARAIYDNPVFIVLDEPNSNLDEQGEMSLLKTVEELKSTDTTVVIITHRPSILKATNKILVMNSGKVEKYGNSDEVLGSISRQNPSSQQKTVQMTQPQQIKLSKPGS